MKDSINFSIVIPFGGNSDLLLETIQSVFDQSYENWELSVIDDATNLDLAKILQKYTSRLRIITLPEKVGIARIFDLAVDELQGEIGMILAADDVLNRDFLLHMADVWTRNRGFTLVLPRVITINEFSSIETGFLDNFKRLLSPTNVRKVLKGRLLVYSLIIGNWMYFTSSTFKISELKALRFRPDLKITMDWELSLRMGLTGHSFGYSAKSIFYYRRHSNSFSMHKNSSMLRLEEELGVLKSTRRLARKLGLIDIWLVTYFHFFSQLNYLFREFQNRQKSHRDQRP